MTIPDDALAQLEHLGRGESLPARWYTDPAIAEAEETAILRRAWIYVGPADGLATVGDYVTCQIGGVPVLAVRNEEGLAGFVNVCRHRRHEVVQGSGRVRLLQCPYHAWTYDLAGVLRRVPRGGSQPDLQPADLSLIPVRVERLGPFVFANLDPAAASASDCFGPALARIADAGIDLDSLVLHGREEWRGPANWKTMLENYLECYHCPTAHPGFSQAIDVRPDRYTLEALGWVFSQAGPVREHLDGAATGRLAYDVRGTVRMSQYHLLWPNTTININPGFPNLSIDTWMPDGPHATRGVSEQYFAPGVDPGFARDLVAFNHQVAAEDELLTDSVQRGLRAGIPERGRFVAGSEHLVLDFQRMVARSLAGLPPLAAAR